MVLAGPRVDQTFVIGLEATSVWERLAQARADQQHFSFSFPECARLTSISNIKLKVHLD